MVFAFFLFPPHEFTHVAPFKTGFRNTQDQANNKELRKGAVMKTA